MARTGVLPRQLTKVHPTYKTPVNAIGFQTIVNIGLGLILPIGVGVANVYNITGTWFTFALAPVYAAANVGLYLYVRKHDPASFNWFKHALVPLAGTVALGFVVYYSLNPLPAWPIKLAPLVVVLWLGLGVVMLVAMIMSGKESLLARAGDAVMERIETPEEHAARPEFI
jgi:amino acid transporter